MSLYHFCLIIITIILLSFGQILFKNLALSFNDYGITLFDKIVNINFFFAFFVYGAAAFCWLVVLRFVALRIAFSFYALTFFTVPLLAHFFLNEQIHRNTILGAIFIICGVILSSYR